jgi:hypothetical protein
MINKESMYSILDPLNLDPLNLDPLDDVFYGVFWGDEFETLLIHDPLNEILSNEILLNHDHSDEVYRRGKKLLVSDLASL